MLVSQHSFVAAQSVRVGALLSALVLFFGPWIAGARAAGIVIPHEFGSARAHFDWHLGDIQKNDLDILPIAPAYAQVANPAQIKVSAYQDSNGVNAVFADSGSALSELPDFHAKAETAYEFVARSILFQSGTTNLTFVINGGELRIRNFGELVDRMGRTYVSAKLVILRASGPAGWELYASLGKVGGVPDLDLPAIGNSDSFGIGFPALAPVLDGNDAVVTIPRFEGTIPIDLGEFLTGVAFTYEMTAGVDFELAPISNVGGLARIGDPFSLSTGGPSTHGVEIFLDGMPLGSFARVPEPGCAVLLTLSVVWSDARWRRRPPPQKRRT